MAKCSQCHLDGGLKVGRVKMMNLEARFEIELLGAKFKVCKGHREKFEKAAKDAGVELRYIALKTEKEKSD